mmetsp:Transcript_59078/g.120420  ORF Transcript_59078/g.120420 Transcript_59078/m.120420 type:complete len:91 (+) Transcript_59078:60-332(+)
MICYDTSLTTHRCFSGVCSLYFLFVCFSNAFSCTHLKKKPSDRSFLDKKSNNLPAREQKQLFPPDVPPNRMNQSNKSVSSCSFLIDAMDR